MEQEIAAGRLLSDLRQHPFERGGAGAPRIASSSSRLRARDFYIRGRIDRRLAAARDTALYTGPFLLDGNAPQLPGSRMIYLSQSEAPHNYYDLDRNELWRPTAEAEEFSELMAFIPAVSGHRTHADLLRRRPDRIGAP